MTFVWGVCVRRPFYNLVLHCASLIQVIGRDLNHRWMIGSGLTFVTTVWEPLFTLIRCWTVSNVHTIIHTSERPTCLSTTTHLRMRCGNSAISCLDKGLDPANDMETLSRMLMATIVGRRGWAAIIIYRIKTPTMVQNTLYSLQNYSGLHMTRLDGY